MNQALSSVVYFHSMKRSQVLVFVQFACIGFFLVSGPAFARHSWALGIELVGLAIGIWAVITMGLGKISVFPEPRHNSTLLERGPYRWIRHPMYTAVLLVCGSLAGDRMEEAGIAVFVVLVFNQLRKLRYEEHLLTLHFGEDYLAYKERTWAILPYLF